MTARPWVAHNTAFNHDRPAFKGPGQIPLAKAINWAIDRHALVQAAGYLGGKRTDQILPPAMGRPASIYPVNGVTAAALAKARALLAQAKFKPKSLVLWSPSFGLWGPGAQILQYNLKRIGIDVQIQYFQSFGQMNRLRRPHHLLQHRSTGTCGRPITATPHTSTIRSTTARSHGSDG